MIAFAVACWLLSAAIVIVAASREASAQRGRERQRERAAWLAAQADIDQTEFALWVRILPAPPTRKETE